MDIVFSALSRIYFLVSLVAIVKWYEYAKEKKLRELVTWSALGGYSPSLNRYNYLEDLLFKIHQIQFIDGFNEKYRISGDLEDRYLKEIIEEFQNDVMRSYFKGHLRLIKSKYAVDGDAYFMFTLYDFLKSHCDDYEFLGHSMRKERIHSATSISSMEPDSNTAYSYSKFAVVYNKVFYISYFYSKKSKITNPSGEPYWMDWIEKGIKEILDSEIDSE